jgi:uncharacterized protein YjbI with pentapeptide repeats
MGARARECPYCRESLEPVARESVFDDQMEVDEVLKGEVDEFTIAYLRGAELRGACLGGVDLFDADLVAADLRGADLGGANLGNADLRGADLRGANLLGADLSDAKLGRAVYDGFTIWPEGFDPTLSGAILM